MLVRVRSPSSSLALFEFISRSRHVKTSKFARLRWHFSHSSSWTIWPWKKSRMWESSLAFEYAHDLIACSWMGRCPICNVSSSGQVFTRFSSSPILSINKLKNSWASCWSKLSNCFLLRIRPFQNSEVLTKFDFLLAWIVAWASEYLLSKPSSSYIAFWLLILWSIYSTCQTNLEYCLAMLKWVLFKSFRYSLFINGVLNPNGRWIKTYRMEFM